jgi:hypothetical protein
MCALDAAGETECVFGSGGGCVYGSVAHRLVVLCCKSNRGLLFGMLCVPWVLHERECRVVGEGGVVVSVYTWCCWNDRC